MSLLDSQSQLGTEQHLIPASWHVNQAPRPYASLSPLIPYRKGAVIYLSLLHLPMGVYVHRCTSIYNNYLAIHLSLVPHFQIFHNYLDLSAKYCTKTMKELFKYDLILLCVVTRIYLGFI